MIGRFLNTLLESVQSTSKKKKVKKLSLFIAHLFNNFGKFALNLMGKL